MSKTELSRWNKKVIEYAKATVAQYGTEKAEQMVWRKFGTPCGMRAGKFIIQFGKEIVEL